MSTNCRKKAKIKGQKCRFRTKNDKPNIEGNERKQKNLRLGLILLHQTGWVKVLQISIRIPNRSQNEFISLVAIKSIYLRSII